MINKCPVCNFADVEIIFEQHAVPVFQNKVYSTAHEAEKAIMGHVKLSKCNLCGFIYNADFDNSLMIYDENYQNEQAHSNFFNGYLKNVFDKLDKFGIKGKKVVEIGCGKGHFLEMLVDNGIDVTGFDPTYEGTSERVIKDYFSEQYNNINADVIILRHTMEHINYPLTFISEIAKANNHKGKIFIEVPTFDWIEKKGAFWDIFYEHCNYFTESTLGMLFEDCETGSLFDAQYIYVWADLSKLKSVDKIKKKEHDREKNLNKLFSEELRKLNEFLEGQSEIIIWGAGAKGSTFLNLLDPGKEKIKYVIDINPAKQNKFIAHTGHPIYSPGKIIEDKINLIIIMNENYKNEIEALINNNNILIKCL